MKNLSINFDLINKFFQGKVDIPLKKNFFPAVFTILLIFNRIIKFGLAIKHRVKVFKTVPVVI